MSRIVLCLSHAIEEHDQLRLLTSIGHEVFSIGGYIRPSEPHDPKRPPLDIPYYPELHAAVDAIGSDDNLGAAQTYLPDAVLDWADVLIYHHNLGRLYGQWDRIRDWRTGSRRVIWRTVGQSVEANERDAHGFRADGLEIVRYSPKERNIPGYAGEDAVIRFWKDPDEWGGWTGDDPTVVQFVQNFRARYEWCNRAYFEAATEGLPHRVYGPQSDELLYGGGQLSLPEMQAVLRRSRAYLYTGTQPASYTLGLIEAMMTGIPVVSIGPSHMTIFAYGPDLFEGSEIAGGGWDNPTDARDALRRLLDDPDRAARQSQGQRAHAITLFGRETIARQWAEYLA